MQKVKKPGSSNGIIEPMNGRMNLLNAFGKAGIRGAVVTLGNVKRNLSGSEG